MNPWIPALVTIAVQLVVAGVIYGRLSETVRSNTRRIDGHDLKFTAVAEDVTDQGNKIATIEGALRWNKGHD